MVLGWYLWGICTSGAGLGGGLGHKADKGSDLMQEGKEDVRSTTADALHAAEDAYAKILWRVKFGATTLALATFFLFLGVWLSVELSYGPCKEYTLSQRELIKTIAAVGTIGAFPIAALAVLPTDEGAVRAINTFGSQACGFLGLLMSILACYGSSSSDSWVGARIQQMLFLAQSILGFYLYRRFKQSRAMPPRAALSFTWKSGHLAARMLSNIWIVYVCALFAFVYGGRLTPERIISHTVLALGPRFYVAITAAQHIQALQSWLGVCCPASPTRSADAHVRLPCLMSGLYIEPHRYSITVSSSPPSTTAPRRALAHCSAPRRPRRRSHMARAIFVRSPSPL